MKKVINGLLYNTATATCVGTWDNGKMSSDFDSYCESLYRKKTGEYFLHGEGGPMSIYGIWHGNNGGWGEQIRPYTPAEARQWANEKLTVDECSAEFGEPVESLTGKINITISVLQSTKQKLEQLRQETGKSMSQIVDELVSSL